METKEQKRVCWKSSELVNLITKNTCPKDTLGVFILQLVPWLNLLLVCPNRPATSRGNCRQRNIDILVLDSRKLSVVCNSNMNWWTYWYVDILNNSCGVSGFIEQIQGTLYKNEYAKSIESWTLFYSRYNTYIYW